MDQIKKHIKSKAYSPVYLLHGDEAYFIDEAVKLFETKVLTEAEKSFNFSVLYGKDSTAQQIIDTCMRYPLMASHQMVILKEAQDLKDLDALSSYLKNPVASTIFVIAHKHKKIDMRKAIGKLIKEKAYVFESKKIYDNKITDWISSYLASKKIELTPNAATMLAEHLGTNLSKVVNELDKLALLVGVGETVSDKLIQEHIGISKDFTNHNLQTAIVKGDLKKAFQISEYFAADQKRNPLIVTIGSLSFFFLKLYASFSYSKMNDFDMAKKMGFSPKNQYAAKYRVENYRLGQKRFGRLKTQNVLEVLETYDLKSKGVKQSTINGGQLLKQMLIEIVS